MGFVVKLRESDPGSDEVRQLVDDYVITPAAEKEVPRCSERKAQITLSRLLLIARALEALDGFGGLFAPRPAESLAEIETRQRPRLRGRRRRR